MAAFADHLTRVRGAASGTRRIYVRYARALLNTCGPNAQHDWSALTADRIAGFVRTQAETLSRSASRAPVSATRSFLRFLVSVGAVRPGLEGAIPTVRQWKLAALPRALADTDVERVLTTIDNTAALGARDQAIVLLLSRLGQLS